ncbi:MAG: peptidoglycan DD-metalloendopeptidase family protein [Methylacidiphilales bacterium]|nr:peptidoglycan DD-metalloendopeptidase family protein [Candidatus Methylacidiphilales bacterium]
MQPNLPNNTSSQDNLGSDILVEKNYCRFQTTALKLGFAISVGTAGILLVGQTNQAFAAELVDVNSLDNEISEDLSNSKGERIAKAVVRKKADVQKLADGIDDRQTELITDSKQSGTRDHQQISKITEKLKSQQQAAIRKLQHKSDRLRSSLAELSSADGNRNSNSPSPIKGSSFETHNFDSVKSKAKQYEVQAGDTLARIALRHGVSIADIIQANRLINPNQLKISQRLNIPEPEFAAENNYGIGGDTPIPQGFAEVNRTNVAKQNSTNPSLISEIESLRQKYRAQQSRYQQTTPGSIYSSNPTPIAVPRYNQNSTPILIPVPAPITPRKDGQSIASSVRNNQMITPIPVDQYPRVTRVSPNLPPLAAVDRYLPRPIDENTAPPVVPGATNTAYIWPAKGVLTSGYGMRWGRMHRGIDIANKIGTPILAAASGVVEFEGSKRGYGNLVDVRHIDGSLTRYAHNHRHFVRVGQKVQQGEMIAHMGNTGFSTGPHLHFEIRPSGKGAVNPIAYLPPRV